MKGARPLTNEEICAVRDAFTGKYEDRNRGLFMLGVSVGGRISELLALTVGDVWQNDQPVSDLLFSKHIVKGKEESRVVPVNVDGKAAIQRLVDWHTMMNSGRIDAASPLFASRNGAGVKPITRQNADMALRRAFMDAGLNGQLATHSLRKSFAQRLYDITHDIYVVKELLGHKNIVTTQAYLGINYVEVRGALEQMSLVAWQEYANNPLYKYSDGEIVNETLRRGYTISSLETHPS